MKQLLPGLMLAFCVFTTLSSCKKQDSDSAKAQRIHAIVKANETYSYDLGGFGDEEGAVITRQAMHYQVSSISDPGTYPRIYTYKPALNYTGTDEVEIRSVRGSRFGEPGDKIIITQIEFTIVN